MNLQNSPWNQIKSQLQQESLSDGMKAAILSSVDCSSWEESQGQRRLVFTVPSTFHQESAERLLREDLLRALGADTDSVPQIQFHVHAEQISFPAEELEPVQTQDSSPGPENIQWITKGGQLNPRMSLDRFVWSSGTELARLGLQRMLAPQTSDVRQMFIHGPSGLGKTHVLHGLGLALRSAHPLLRIRICSADEFMGDFTSACRTRSLGEFKKRYRHQTDVLLIDDIHCIAGGKSTQDEFFNTYNYFVETGKIMVFTSDKSPRCIKGLEERLITRFEGGLVAEFGAPDAETLFKIGIQKSLDQGYNLSADVIEVLCAHANSNVRALEGLLLRFGLLQHSSKVKGGVSEVKAQLGEAPAPNAELSVDAIVAGCAADQQISVSLIKSASRKREVVRARKQAMCRLRTELKLSYAEIGRIFGKDHSSVMSAIKGA